ncbi:MAG: TonB-dependent receptor [Verrucomicrobia bacterium]|nr:TonB-dependent receptor [Verrucomicrobiota bacterium]
MPFSSHLPNFHPEPRTRPRRGHRSKVLRGWAAGLLGLGLLGPASFVHAAEANPAALPPAQLGELSLEQLMNLEVISVSKRAEKISSAPAAIFVLTQDDLRHIGVTSLAEALRLVPGLNVARADAHTWAVSARGFNDVFANKLLVQIDGRSVYTPLFSGVHWDVQDTLLEDIDRIEVVRGPGGTLWGANAVNGVINILTKPAKDTLGLLVTAGGGTEEHGYVGARYGLPLADRAWLRFYGKYFNRDDSVMLGSERPGEDDWRVGQGGFRLDWEPSQANALTLQGDLYAGREEQIFHANALTPPYALARPNDLNFSGGNVLGRWTHAFSAESELQVQLYFDRTVRNSVSLHETRDTYDLDAQHHFPLGARQEVVWGVGYRFSHDELGDGLNIFFPDHSRDLQLFSAFAQDEIALVKDRLKLTVGSKFEHNDFSGFEAQPSARLAWEPHERHTLWASVARAVRTPSRAEAGVRINGSVLPPGPPGPPASSGAALPAMIGFFGSEDFRSEHLLAYELGYRLRPHERVALDLAGFFNDYAHLRSLEQGTPRLEGTPLPTNVLLPMTAANHLVGTAYGMELAANYQLADWWRLTAAYTFLELQVRARHGSTDISAPTLEGQSPQQQFTLRSSLDLPGQVELDAALRYVDQLPGLGVPAYTALDVRLGWRPVRNLELSLVGQNLLDDRHPEFLASPFTRTQSTEVERSFFGKLTWRF